MANLSAIQKLSGTLSAPAGLSGSLSTPGGLNGALSVPRIISPEIYDGEYEVIPEAYNEQTLETAHKLLTADVNVKEIPYYETTNEGGGYTVIIG